ncbi:MAG: peroxidase family protein [Hydrogenophaga sp.]
MSKGRHGTNEYLVGTQIRTMDANGDPVLRPATPEEKSANFLFSGFVADDFQGIPNSDALIAQVAVAMTHHVGAKGAVDQRVPAGYTYLGQFIDHDLTLDDTELDLQTTVAGRLKSKRSPTLDLDSLYGDGPDDIKSAVFYQADGVQLLTNAPARVPPEFGDMAIEDRSGFDLPRRGDAKDGVLRTAREAKIPDIRNDENLAIAQLHAAMIRFHNKVATNMRGTVPDADLFERVRERVTHHYQWVVLHDYLPRIMSQDVLNDVFTHGRRVFEKNSPSPLGTMPVEFSGAAFRLGHSMIRTTYEWNKNFGSQPDALDSGHIFRLFRFSGTSGKLVPTRADPGSAEDLRELEDPAADSADQLPSNWVADWLRLFDFSRFEASDPAFKPAAFNHAFAIDTHLVDPLATLPMGSFGATEVPLLKKRNLAFRNLARGRMLKLPSGQQMATALAAAGCILTPLTAQQLLEGGPGGVSLAHADTQVRTELVSNTPLWFYILREAEFNDKKLAGVGARIVGETMHRALEGSRYSILGSTFKPTLGPGAAQGRFDMADLLHTAFDGQPQLLNPF